MRKGSSYARPVPDRFRRPAGDWQEQPGASRERPSAVYLDKDTIKGCIIAVAEQMKIGQGLQLSGPLSYELLVTIAKDNLVLGRSVVLDSPAAYQIFRDKVKQLARSLKVNLRLIECICTDERLLRQRLESRSAGSNPPSVLKMDYLSRACPIRAPHRSPACRGYGRVTCCESAQDSYLP